MVEATFTGAIPVEEAFAKIKNLLRKAAARTKGALVEAIAAGLSAISAQDARGFFEMPDTVLQVSYCETCCNAILVQDMYGLRVEVEFFQDAIGVLPDVGDRSHETLDTLHSDWWDQGS